MNLAGTLIEAQPGKFRLWPSVWKLLRLRAFIYWNTFRRGKMRAKIGTILLLVLILGGMGLLFFLSSLLLTFLHSPELAKMIDPAPLLRAIPTLVLSAAFLVIVVTNFGVLLQALYLSHDMDFLVSSPISMRAVFLAKMLEAILPNFALFCAFSLPVLFGLGASSQYNILYFPLLIVMLVMLALAAGGLAAVLVMAVVRVFPARRVAEVLGFFGAMATVLCGQSGNIIRVMKLDRSDVAGTLNLFTQLNMPWSPIAWAGRGLDAIGRSDWLPGLGLTVLSLALAGALFGGTLFLAEQLYYTGWSSMQGSARRKRPVRTAEVPPAVQPAPQAANRAFRLIPRPIRGLVLKDLLLLRRDPRNVSQMITPLIVGFVFLFTTQGGGRNATEALDRIGLRNLEVYGLMILAIFVGWMLLFNLATLAFSREGRNYWLTKTAPIRSWHLIMAKFLVSYLPGLAFSLFYTVLAFLIRGIDWAFLPFVILVVIMVMAGGTGISLAFGIAGANLEWDSPQRQRLRGTTGCIAFLVVAGYMVLDLALFVLPSVLWQIFANETPLVSYLIGCVMGIAGAGVAAVLPLRMVVSRLALIGEVD